MSGHPREDSARRLVDIQTQSLLGGALLGQKNSADAELLLLLKGHEGMRAREKTIPPQGNARIPKRWTG